MYQDDSKGQCLICHQPIYKDSSLYHVFFHSPICYSCMAKFSYFQQTSTLQGYPLYIIYQYNEFFRSMLYQYKGQYDMALFPIFLFAMQKELSQRYNDYIVVIIPSSKQDNEKRGFCPNQKIVETFSTEIFLGLYKARDYKQTKQQDRSNIFQVLKINGGDRLTGRKIVIFDDVITSGNTLLAALSLIEACHPKTIEILILASKQKPSFYV